MKSLSVLGNMRCDLSNVHNLITPLLTLSWCGLKDRQTHLNVSLAENSLPRYIYLKSEKSTQSSQTVFVNVKILILSYKISIFPFIKILLEQRYLEMISSLRNYFLLLCFFPCLDHCSYNITRAHNIMMYYVYVQ